MHTGQNCNLYTARSGLMRHSVNYQDPVSPIVSNHMTQLYNNNTHMSSSNTSLADSVQMAAKLLLEPVEL